MRVDGRPLVMHLVYRFDVGGLENGIVNLVNRMPEDAFAHMVVALTHCAPAFCARIRRADVGFVSLDKPPGHGVKLYPRLYRLFRRYRPAIVHTRNLAALEAVVPAMAAGVPVRIHGEHGWEESDPAGTRAKYRLVRRLYRPFVSHYVALSGHLASYLTGVVGVPQARVSRICNGVDAQRFRPGPGRREPLPDSPFDRPDVVVFGTVGRLQAVKDQVTLVRAFARLVARGGPQAARLRLMIAGDGPLRGAVEAAVAETGSGDRIWVAGERSDVAAVMRSLDVYVLPSLAEGISNTILEAMASGLPVVATHVGGNVELVSPDDTGLLVPPADEEMLADALARYADDPALRCRHGAAGRLRVESEFDLDGMVERYAQLYRGLLGRLPDARAAA